MATQIEIGLYGPSRPRGLCRGNGRNRLRMAVWLRGSAFGIPGWRCDVTPERLPLLAWLGRACAPAMDEITECCGKDVCDVA